jgi:hypothetical protein
MDTGLGVSTTDLPGSKVYKLIIFSMAGGGIKESVNHSVEETMAFISNSGNERVIKG